MGLGVADHRGVDLLHHPEALGDRDEQVRAEQLTACVAIPSAPPPRRSHSEDPVHLSSTTCKREANAPRLPSVCTSSNVSGRPD